MSLRYDRCAPKHGADMAMTRFVMYVRSRSKPDCVYVCERERGKESERRNACLGKAAAVLRDGDEYICVCMYMYVYARICMYMYVYI